jgi:hypothetical protein
LPSVENPARIRKSQNKLRYNPDYLDNVYFGVNQMASISISYAKADEGFARALAAALEKNGHCVSFLGTLLIGQRWQDALSTFLREADAVIFVVSKASIDDRWLLAEVGTALGYFQERGRPQVLPLVIDDVPLPPQFSQIQCLIVPDRNFGSILPHLEAALSASAGRMQARTEEKLQAQARIETNAAEYIGRQLSELRAKEKSFRRTAYVWYSAALIALIGGVSFALWRAFATGTTAPTWQSIVYLAVASVIVVGLLGALSRFAFILGKSFMVESLRNGDRIHAISFGEFYLKTFPEKTEWSEIKEAFQHWNIDSGSSFKTQSASDIDPQILQVAIEIAKTIVGKVKDKD